MAKFPCDDTSRIARLRVRPGFTMLAILMLSLGVGVTTALLVLVDAVAPPAQGSAPCETAIDFSRGSPVSGIARAPSAVELRDRVSEAYEMSVESATDAIDGMPDLGERPLGRPVLALIGAAALAFLVACARAASGMIARPRGFGVAVGTMVGALAVTTLALHALDLPVPGLRAAAFALCVSLLALCYARALRRAQPPLAMQAPEARPLTL